MGDCSIYAVRESGHVRLYYSHWGALTIAEDVFWGPARTEEFICKNEPTSDWLDSVWAQGGIALDKDKRRMTRKLVTAAPSGPIVITLDQLGKNLLEGSLWYGLLSVKSRTGWQDYAIDFLLPGLLMNGPSLLDGLSSIAGLDELRTAFARCNTGTAETLGDWLDEFCVIDTEQRTLVLTLPDHEEQWVPFVCQAWNGWTVVHEPGGVATHFERTGRALPMDFQPSQRKPEITPPSTRPFDQCVRLIREHIEGNERRKMADLTKRTHSLKQLNLRDGPVTVAAGFLRRIPSSEPRLIDRLRPIWQLWQRRR